MNFQVVQQVAGMNFVPAVNSKTKRPLVYSCPKRAASIASRLTKVKGVKHQPRPIVDAVDWQAREQKRLADGTYKPVSWVGQGWYKAHAPVDHFIHVSVEDPTRVAFVRNAKDGAMDHQTAVRPGVYLTEFFKDVLTKEQIKKYAMEHSMAFETNGIKFATLPEEIERVYIPKLGSCFAGTTKANLYGSGDFAVAYIEDEAGNVTARAVCCPARKIYTRPYGDDTRLRKLLNDMGFKDTYYGNNREYDAWKGLRLVKKWHWGNFYADFRYGGVAPHPTDPEFLVIV